MAFLLFKDGQGRDGTVELSPTTAVFVGRGLDCAIRTDDGMVSRRHAQFLMENGRFVVEDLGSANGTHVNGVRIQKQAVNHTDVIQCGSLIVRFVDQRGAPQGDFLRGGGRERGTTAPPPKKGGTMVLEQPPKAPPGGGDGFAGGANFAGPGGLQMAPPPGVAAHGLFGEPPAMPMATEPFGAPPAVSDDSGSSKLPFGGPPKMPPGAPPPNATRDLSAPGSARRGRDSAQPADRAAAPSLATPGSPPRGTGEDVRNRTAIELGLAEVPRDLGDRRQSATWGTPSTSDDAQRLAAELQALRAKLEQTTANYEREVADGKRARAEAGALRDRIEELRAAVNDRDEQVAAHDRVADQLRDELHQLRSDHNKLKSEMAELADTASARGRQVARGQEDAQKMRDQMQDLNRQLMELSRTKDEGWTKLNDQLSEIEQLRSVINEQERMLEDRRVGLVSQEHVIKELRSDKERSLQTVAQLKAECDRAVTEASRTSAQVVAVEEENRRLGRLLVEAHSDQARGGDVDHMARLTADIKDVRVELKKAEADRDRVQQQSEAAERDRRTLEDRLARVEVELQEALEGKRAAESSRNLAQEALAKSELARQKATEEALAASRAAAAVVPTPAPLPVAVSADPSSGEFGERVREIYDSVSDIMSEMRNNLALVQRELANVTAPDPTRKAVDDAVEALVDSAETAKGALRGLRDLAEGKS